MPSPGPAAPASETISTPAPRLRAVFDTNVVVSTLVFGGRLLWLRRAWAKGTVVPIVCRETVSELLRVLAYPKFRLTTADRDALLGDYLPFGETVTLPTDLPALPLACRDRNDAVFLYLCIAGRADLLVSGDADLAVLAAAYPVTSPSELRQRLEQGPEEIGQW